VFISSSRRHSLTFPRNRFQRFNQLQKREGIHPLALDCVLPSYRTSSSLPLSLSLTAFGADSTNAQKYSTSKSEFSVLLFLSPSR
jgi:hypothetical protein